MAEARRLCVYCGSTPGNRPAFAAAADELGRLLARSGIGVVYGGASVGLMGRVADAALDAGGEVIGVLPGALFEREIAHPGLTELRVVGSMHERKALMAELADGFVALPGGYGTIEELVEAVTWNQLGIHAKPVGLVNIEGYFDHLLAFLDRAVADGLLAAANRSLLVDDPDPAVLVARLRAGEATPAEGRATPGPLRP